jgi:hypothetical protein
MTDGNIYTDNCMVLMNILWACGHIHMAWLIYGYTDKMIFGDIETCPYCTVGIYRQMGRWRSGQMGTWIHTVETWKY